MYKIVLIRHGESTWNLDNRFTGWTDVPLTATGVEQARQSGRLLREQGERARGAGVRELRVRLVDHHDAEVFRIDPRQFGDVVRDFATVSALAHLVGDLGDDRSKLGRGHVTFWPVTKRAPPLGAP